MELIKMKLSLSALSLAALFSFNAAANQSEQVTESPFKFSLFAGITDGGDKLASISYEDEKGKGAGSENIKAGDFLNIGAGVEYSFNKAWSVQSNIGYFFDSDSADNADIEITRFVVEAVPYYHINEKFKFGIGLTLHLNPEFENDYTNIIASKTEYDNATAAVFSLGYKIEHMNSWFELRYVPMDYSIKSQKVTQVFGQRVNLPVENPDKDVDASHIGISWHYQF
ncbi:hypothetical protein D9981_04595 [Pseudoalteromonas phenolica O-BC30]|nr:hypothetical protein D9981_04595 [Pseudoalteromonas phenolica O-BC30]